MGARDELTSAWARTSAVSTTAIDDMLLFNFKFRNGVKFCTIFLVPGTGVKVGRAYDLIMVLG